MPQREFWTERHPSELVVHYRSNLVEPDLDPVVCVHVRDQAGDLMENTALRVPVLFVHEAVEDVMRSAWEGFLFGDAQDACRAAVRSAGHWRGYARDRSRHGV